MAKKFTKVLCALLAFVMCLGTVPAFAIESAPDAAIDPKAAWPIDKTANGLDENDQTDVTLTVPGTMTGVGADIVFVMGSGVAASKNMLSYLKNTMQTLLQEFEGSDAKLKLGIVCFENSTERETVLPLTVLTEDNMDQVIEDALQKYTDEKLNENGIHVNMESALQTAKDMLDADNSVPADRKHLIMMSTGYSWTFDDENGNAATIVGTDYHGNYTWGQMYYIGTRNGATGTTYPGQGMRVPFNWSWDTYWGLIQKWVKADGDDYVFTLGYKDENGEFVPTTYEEMYYATDIVNGTAVQNNVQKAPNNNSSYRQGLTILVPKYAAAAAEKALPHFPGIYGLTNPTGDTANAKKAAHAINYERSMYDSYKIYEELRAEGTHCYAITTYMGGNKYVSSETVKYFGDCFMDMMAGGTSPRYSQTENYFDPIHKEIIYSCSVGSTVEDFIGKNENGNFEFIQDAETIKLVVGGNEYTTERIEAKEGATASYQFTIKEMWNLAAEPTFWLDYYYGDGETTERFVWTFGENVSMENRASLTYKLQLTEKKEDAGEYTVPTNNSATLYPIDSYGNDGDPQHFPVPFVEYEVSPFDVDIVIALGAGIANKKKTVDSIHTLVKPLIDDGINVKLGLVAVEHYDDVALPLTVLTKDNYATVIADGLNKIISMPAGPTNLHGNIVAAKEMLDADTSVPANNKFFYVIATGRTYNYDNADGVPTTIVNKINLKGKTYYYWGHYLWQSQRGQHTSLYRVPTSYNNDFAAYWADVEKWVEADGDTYAYSFTDAYNVNDPQWFNTFYNANNKDAKDLGLASSRFGWIMNPLTNSGHAGISEKTNPQHALSYERAQYEAYYAYAAMVEAGYTCQALCSESVNYQNYSPYMEYQKVTPSIQLGHSFMDHMAKLSGQDEATLLFNLIDDNGNYVMAENFFTAVETDKLVPSTAKALKFSALSTNLVVAIGEVASVTVVAEGDNLTYTWYYKSLGSDDFSESSFKDDTYQAVMRGCYDEHQVYCVVSDQFGNSVTTETVTLILDN